MTALRAPMAALCGRDGQLREHGVQGVYAYDRRLLSGAVVRVSGVEPECLGTTVAAASTVVSTCVVRGAGDRLPDPTVLLHRTRVAEQDRVLDVLRFESRAQAEVVLDVELELAADLAELDAVKQGRSTPALRPLVDGARVRWSTGAVGAEVGAEVAVQPAPREGAGGERSARLAWTLALAPGQSAEVRLVVTGSDRGTPAPFAGAGAAPWVSGSAGAAVTADDPRVAPLAHRGLDDLQALLLRDGDDLFAAAGSPWFFTLFGRDSLWTARLLLPFGTELALGTLRSLARRQGRADVPETEEEPGKILHEVRRDGLDVGELSLPPVYFGTVDATALWVVLLVDAWRWGADPRAVEELLPACEAALGWLRTRTDEDPTGFLRYADRGGAGLANQGWKDSGDSVQWADGRLAEGPIALSEVQAYSHEAAVGAADLLDAFGRPGGDALRRWAEALRTRFRAAFWVRDAAGRYPAIALDRDGRAVDSVASNMGHLLGTGLLDADEAAAVAARLARPDMDSGHGLRTLTSTSPRFSPLSYHGGAVWPHDTAIAARGLLLEGHDDVACSLLGGLLVGGTAFADRLPELYAGVQAGELPPLPYPASCRPQAWSAAAGTCVATLSLGLRPDVPAGRLVVRPPAAPWGAVAVTGLRLGAHPLEVAVDRSGAVTATSSSPDVVLHVPQDEPLAVG